MRTLLTLAALAGLTLSASAQKFTKYYDRSSKPTEDASKARYVSIVEFKDPLWFRFDYYFPEKTQHLQGSYKDTAFKVKHGDFLTFHLNQKVESKGTFVNNREQGLWLRYHDNGALADSAVFDHGRVQGYRLKWHANGAIADSIAYAPDGSGVHYSWFDNGAPSNAGRYGTDGKKTGKWQYFHLNGQLSTLEEYEAGKLTALQYFDEQGKTVSDTSHLTRKADFKGGTKGWANYLSRNLNGAVPVNNGAPEGSYTVIISFKVDIDGNVTDIIPMTNMGYGMEREVVRILRNGPKWIPAMDHGRKLIALRKQPVTFIVQRRTTTEYRTTNETNPGRMGNQGNMGNTGMGF
ncbi:hypothetical protein V9K67_10680 [Paraflavisolibacter sp. H34]|uniref:hypothetical protein n=1 Tax=Huijunlia imazamoxiresistens TaxID=3127457 RepID=UPI0030192939